MFWQGLNFETVKLQYWNTEVAALRLRLLLKSQILVITQMLVTCYNSKYRYKQSHYGFSAD